MGYGYYMRTKSTIEIIRTELRKSRITRAQISRMTGIEPSVLCRIVSGEYEEITVQTADKLFAVFGYEVRKRKPREPKQPQEK